MTHVVTEPFFLRKYTDCVKAYLIDTFRDGKNMLVIGFEECIDWQLCVPERPVNAIYPGDEVSEDKQVYFENNEKPFRHGPVINGRRLLVGDDECTTKNANDHFLDPENAK